MEKKLSRLISQNRGVPILPIIECEDGERFAGVIEEVRADEYVTVYIDGEKRIFTRADEGALEELFADMLTPRDRRMSEKECDELLVKVFEEVERLPWRRAIVVSIS